MKSGWALKRLGEEEGEDRFVLRDLRSGKFLKMDAEDAALFQLLDGERSVIELLGESERLVGPGGPGRLARLIADLADRGLLEGVERPASGGVPETRLQRLFKPRERTWDWIADYFVRAYHHWGRIFFSPLAATLLVLLALAGFGAFTYIVGARYGTPFVVANDLVIGGAVFLVGRFVIVAIHEFAHGLALAHYGRRAPRAGLRLVLIFPYAFVDTSEAYFEPRSHRIVISAAGPASDLTFGAVFSFAMRHRPAGNHPRGVLPAGVRRLPRRVLQPEPVPRSRRLQHPGRLSCDEPELRQRARRQFAERLSGRGRAESTSPVLAPLFDRRASSGRLSARASRSSFPRGTTTNCPGELRHHVVVRGVRRVLGHPVHSGDRAARAAAGSAAPVRPGGGQPCHPLSLRRCWLGG